MKRKQRDEEELVSTPDRIGEADEEEVEDDEFEDEDEDEDEDG